MSPHRPARGGLTINTASKADIASSYDNLSQDPSSQSSTVKRSGTATRRAKHRRSGSGSHPGTPTKTAALQLPLHSRNNSSSSKSSLSPQLSIGKPQTHSRNSSVSKSPATARLSPHRNTSNRSQASTASIAASLESRISSLSLPSPASSSSSDASSPKKLRNSRFRRRKTADSALYQERRNSGAVQSVLSLPTTETVAARRGTTKKAKWSNVVPFLRVERGESIADLMDTGFFNKRLELGQPKRKLTRMPVVALGEGPQSQEVQDVTESENDNNANRIGSMVITPGGFYSGERDSKRFSWSIDKIEKEKRALPIWEKEGHDAEDVLAKIPWASAKRLSLFPQRISAVPSVGQAGPLAVLREEAEEADGNESKHTFPISTKRLSSLRMSFVPSPTEPRALAVLMEEEDDPAADFCESGPEAASTRLTIMPNIPLDSSAVQMGSDTSEGNRASPIADQPPNTPNWPLGLQSPLESSPKSFNVVAVVEEVPSEEAAPDEATAEVCEEVPNSTASSPSKSSKGVRVLAVLAEEPEEEDDKDEALVRIDSPSSFSKVEGARIHKEVNRPTSMMNFTCVTQEDQRVASNRLSKAFAPMQTSSRPASASSDVFEDADDLLAANPGLPADLAHERDHGHTKDISGSMVAREVVPGRIIDSLADGSGSALCESDDRPALEQSARLPVVQLMKSDEADERDPRLSLAAISDIARVVPLQVPAKREELEDPSVVKVDGKPVLKVVVPKANPWEVPAYTHGPIQVRRDRKGIPRRESDASVADWQQDDQFSESGWERSENAVVDSIIDFFASYCSDSTKEHPEESKSEKWHSAPLLDQQLIRESAAVEPKRRVVSEPLRPAPTAPPVPPPPPRAFTASLPSQAQVPARALSVKKPVGVHGPSLGQLLLKRKGLF